MNKLCWILPLSLLFITSNVSAQDPWWDTKWGARLKISVDANGHKRIEKPAEVSLNFTSLLSQISLAGELDDEHLRVLETDNQGAILDEQVPFQFDKDADYNSSSKASGLLIFLLTNNTLQSQTRYYYCYFDTKDNASGKTPAQINAQVSITDNVPHEGESSYRIATPSAVYYYHKGGCGFASLEDTEGNDWIGYHPGGGSSGEYRGIPNIGDFGHPGCETAYDGKYRGTSIIEHQGPLKVTIFSQRHDAAAELRWEIYPNYIKNTVLKMPGNYLWEYEGTPGGSVQASSDYLVRSNGTQTLLSESWSGDIPSPEWMYIGDPGLDRIIYMVNHQDDSHSDMYWTMNNEMTVCAFGREYPCCTPYMSTFPGYFTFGLADASTFATASEFINSAYQDLTNNTADPEKAGAGLITDPIQESRNNLNFLPIISNQQIKIEVYLDEPGGFAINIYDVSGRMVWCQRREGARSGLHLIRCQTEAIINKGKMNDGICYVVLDQASNQIAKKLAFVKHN